MQFANGDFMTRSNDVETVCRRVNPDDWDGDGLANEKDENPLAYDGDFFGVANAMPTNANLDAYYQLDVAAAGALDFATIRVTCDGPSDLGDHVIIARTNQVCHVPLLAGATYAVESNLPLSYSAVSSEHAHIVTNSATKLTVSMPLEFTVERVAMRGGGFDSYIVRTSPVNVGPLIANVSGVCCSCTTNETGFTWSCSTDCECGGFWHEPVVTATWGGYLRPFYWQGWCPCAWHGAGGGGPQIVLDTPDTLFTNNDGGAEGSDVARLVAGLFSPVETNGTLTLEVSDGAAVKVWTTSNRTELVSLPLTWDVADSPCRAFYVEGASERARGDVSFGLRWRGGQGDVRLSSDAAFAVYYPIMNVVNSSLFDNGDLCNPSGIVVGTNACFALEFGSVHPPASEIRWSVVEGAASFVDGNDTGERVRVSSAVPGQRVTLRAQIGGCRSRPPEISAYVVEPLSVKLTVWIVGNDLGTYYASDATTVSNMVSGVNKIYEQIGVSFYIDSICYTNREEWLRLCDMKGNYLRQRRFDLANVAKNTGGVELYFVDYIKPKTLGNNSRFGTVVAKDATPLVIAHELGHSFGLLDVYPYDDGDPAATMLGNGVRKEWAYDDWNNGCGARYYSQVATQDRLIRRLLMCGFRQVETAGWDMSYGSIYGFRRDGANTTVNVGFFTDETRKTPIHK